jgi:hypothetical protein
MKWINLALAVAAFATGMRAAWLWYQASLVVPDPNWPKDYATGMPFQPPDPALAQMGWTAALLGANQNSAALNARAAWWTAITVCLTAISAIVGFLL